MTDLTEILKYILPALIVGAATVITVKFFFDHERENRQQEWKEKNQSVITPIRLQAYERIVLFVERITPVNLILRVSTPDLDARQLQRLLVQQIREEYEHNLSLQIYISIKGWELVKNGKEELIRVINASASEVHPEAPGMDLAQKIFENYLKLEKQPLAAVTEYLKKEVIQFF
ncbi:MAG: hypothetical protein NTU44_08870 [Bacteroidetes bacterium]|nr:hypothetical protein [Bacteroidota bacterium]